MAGGLFYYSRLTQGHPAKEGSSSGSPSEEGCTAYNPEDTLRLSRLCC